MSEELKSRGWKTEDSVWEGVGPVVAYIKENQTLPIAQDQLREHDSFLLCFDTTMTPFLLSLQL